MITVGHLSSQKFYSLKIRLHKNTSLSIPYNADMMLFSFYMLYYYYYCYFLPKTEKISASRICSTIYGSNLSTRIVGGGVHYVCMVVRFLN